MRLLESLTVTQGRLSVLCVEAVNSEPILAVILLTLGICPGGVIFDDGHMTKSLYLMSVLMLSVSLLVPSSRSHPQPVT
jgi:hypothetical protein